MSGRAWPPPGLAGRTAGPRGFTVATDREAAQTTLRGRATGAGGGAYLTPTPGVELVFDRVGGWLSGATMMSGQVSDEGAEWIADVLGTATAALVQEPPKEGNQFLALRARSRALKALSRLARLGAARVTSPVPAARLWLAEAADLARQAGLPRPVQALTAPPAVTCVGSSSGPGILTAASRPPASGNSPPWADAPPGDWLGNGHCLEGMLDLGLVPHGIFRPGLWPGADLAVRVKWDRAPLIVVKVALLPGATPAHLAGCQARLVDAAGRRVLAAAALRFRMPPRGLERCLPGAPPHAWAELLAPAGLGTLARSGAAWVELVGDRRRPVDGTRLRRVRRALRWADAALRAESRPDGLAPGLSAGQWACLAAQAWDRCRADWAAADDPRRAAQAAAAARGAAPRSALPFLAELTG